MSFTKKGSRPEISHLLSPTKIQKPDKKTTSTLIPPSRTYNAIKQPIVTKETTRQQIDGLLKKTTELLD